MAALIYIQVSKVSCQKSLLNVPTNGNVYHSYVDTRLLKHSIPGKSEDDRSAANVTAHFSCDIKIYLFI
jgi:hypothetical protein